MDRSNAIAALRERLADLAGSRVAEEGRGRAPLSTFARPLAAGAVHEWLAEGSGRGWTPPLAVLVDLARRAGEHAPGTLVWIGTRAWPYARMLIAPGDVRGDRSRRHDPARADASLLRRSLFVDPPDAASRLWAIDLALRSPAVCAVIADGCGLDMGATRRLQLAAESTGAIALLARPASDLKTLTAATTRWLVRHEPSDLPSRSRPRPRWTVELLRSKGVQPLSEHDQRVWTLEWHRDACALAVAPRVEDRPREAAARAAPAVRLTG